MHGRGAWLRVLLVGGSLLLSACLPPAGGDGSGGEELYSLNAEDGTLTPLDARRGAIGGSPLPAGRAPQQAVRGQRGGLLVLSIAQGEPAMLSRVQPDGRGWQATPVFPEVKGRAALLASDGGRYAAVSYHIPSEVAQGGCRLALLDQQEGGWHSHRGLCRTGEQIAGLAFRETPQGPTAYLGVAHVRTGDGSHRLLVVDAASGEVRASRTLSTSPAHLQLGAAPGLPSGRLYVMEGAPGADSEYSTQGQWRLLALDPETLEEQQALTLRVETRALTVAPDGSAAYALVAGGRDLLRLDLHSGAVRRLGSLPGHSAGGMAVAGGRLYVPGPLESALWVLDLRDGRLQRTLHPGRRPVAVIAAGAAG